MEGHVLIDTLVFIVYFLAITSLLSTLTKRMSFPYTASLLLIGFFTHFMLKSLHIESHIELGPDMIFFVLLPLLLFESAMKINFHQFRLQFKTITFMSTFGLLLSMFVIGGILTKLLGIPFSIALLFGALISATDPIAVIALFKQLGAPNRLKLVAEGESMFNDAAAVIAFRVVLGIVAAEQAASANGLFQNGLQFVYLFTASMIFGAIVGFIVAQFISTIENDLIVETTLTIALAITSFVIAEHVFHLSGVISTVAAGLVMGNIGRTKISSGVIQFINEFWEYIAFLAISLVFFFAAFSIDFEIILENPIRIVIVIASVLIARAISTYVTFYISNHTPIFKNEPNVPSSWQHVLNWGGLRGVIPLILVYAIPDTVTYKQDILAFTFATFLFSLLVNGLTIEWLMKKLGVHLPKKEDLILKEELDILRINHAREHLDSLCERDEFNTSILQSVSSSLAKEVDEHKIALLQLAKQDEVAKSLRLQAIVIEKTTIEQLFDENHINEAVFFDLDSELDLQQDALEYPEVYTGRGYKRGGVLDRDKTFRERMRSIQQSMNRFPLLGSIFSMKREHIIENRIAALQTRIVCSNEVIKYMNAVEECIQDKNGIYSALETVKGEYMEHKKTNEDKLTELSEEYPEIADEYQTKVVHSIIKHEYAHHHPSHLFMRH